MGREFAVARQRRRLAATVSVFALGLGLTSFAWGQSPAPGPNPQSTPTAVTPAPAAATLDVVVVTAQHRTQNLQDVPISVTALSSDFLAKHDVHSLQDLAGDVPNLVVTNSVSYGNAPISIRGVGGPSGGGSLFNQEPVAVYIDGVYVSQLGQAVSDLTDVGNIQVLRGPQGTLYGRNSTAGAVLITTNRPTKEPSMEASFTGASYDDYRANVALSGPIVGDQLTGRLAIGYHDGGNWATNTADNKPIGGSRDLSGRLSLEYKPTSKLTFTLIGDLEASTADPVTFGLAGLSPVPTGSVLGTAYLGNPFARRPDYQQVLSGDRFYLDTPQYSVTHSDDLTVLANYKLDGGYTLDSITGYRRFKVRGAQDGDAYPSATPLDDNFADQKAEDVSEELRFSSPSNGKLKWSAGVFYEHERDNDDITINSFQGGPPVFNLVFPPNSAPVAVPAFAIAGTSASFDGVQSLNAYAAFADATYNFTDKLALTVGGRYSYESKDVDINQLVTTIVPTIIAGPVLSQSSCPSKAACAADYSNFSPRAVLEYKLTKGSQVYASFSEGYNSGGFNTFGDLITPSDPTNPLKTQSEKIDAYEVGTKNDLFNRRLRVNLDGFYYDYSNLQIREAVYTGGVSLVNVPKAEVKGVELETNYAPIDHLTLTGNVSYLDATITQGALAALPTNIGPIIYGQNLTVGTQNVAGAQLTRAPHWQIYLAADYKYPTSIGDFDASANFKYQSSEYFDEVDQSSDIYKGAAWTETALRIGWASNDGKLGVAAFANNIFDNRHLTQVASFVGFPVGALNTPRVLGVTLTGRY
jgi:iron complex outermembrane receptor protein